MTQIDKNIPIPDPEKVWPFAELQIGDSFFAEENEAPLPAQLYSNFLLPGLGRFVSRNATENGVVGKRIWRIE